MENELKIKVSPEKEKVDKFVYEQPSATIFQTSYIADIFKNTKRADSLILSVINENDEIIASMVAIETIESSNSLKFFTSHSTIRGGPIFKKDSEGHQGLSLLIEYYDKMQKKKSVYSRIYPFNESSVFKSIIEENSYAYEDYLNYLIDLSKTKEEIFRNFKRDKRRAINKAKRYELKIEEAQEKSLIPIFFEMLRETHKRGGFPLKDFSLYESIFNILVSKNLAKFVLAKYNNEYIAGRLILTYKDRIYDWYACSAKKYAYLHPNEFLVWNVLEWGSENGYHVFDFGGAGKPDEEYSVRDFKKQFGGDLMNHGRYTKVYSPLKLKVATKGYNTLQKFIKSRSEVP